MALYTHTHTHTGHLEKSKKKLIISVGILVGIILLGLFALIFSISKTKNTVTEGDTQKFNAGGIINGDKAYISSAQVIKTKTGTGFEQSTGQTEKPSEWRSGGRV